MQKSIINKLSRMQTSIDAMSADIEGFKNVISDKIDKEEMKNNPNDDKLDELECDSETLESIAESLEELKVALQDTMSVIEEAINS